jgi:hypothetical protein
MNVHYPSRIIVQQQPETKPDRFCFLALPILIEENKEIFNPPKGTAV